MRQQQQKQQEQKVAHRRIRPGVKNIEGRVQNKNFKIKQLIAVAKNVQVKKNGQVVRRMTVRRRSIYPAEQQHVEY